jgi:hypothetical protein
MCSLGIYAVEVVGLNLELTSALGLRFVSTFMLVLHLFVAPRLVFALGSFLLWRLKRLLNASWETGNGCYLGGPSGTITATRVSVLLGP